MLRDLRARWQRCVLASGLPDGAKVTLCVLRDFLDREGKAWPSYATLAALSGQSRRAVIDHIGNAERAGLLHVERLPRANVYRAVVSDPDADPKPSPTMVKPGSPAMVHGHSPDMVKRGSPVMVNGGVVDGERQRQLMVNGRSPEIKNKRNTSREIHTPRVSLSDAQFDDFKTTYPKRAGDQGWQQARKAIHARLREGHSMADMLAGARRYAAYCEATDKLGTQYVKQAATFVGPERHFLEPWTPPPTKAQRQQDRNIDAAQEWLDQQEHHDAAH